ncbi:hypothetical protein, partial [Cohnella sp. REN36]
EDILEKTDVIKQDEKINIIQVKHHETQTYDSTYTEAILYFYKNFLIAKINRLSQYFNFTLVKYDLSGEKDIGTIFTKSLASTSKKA